MTSCCFRHFSYCLQNAALLINIFSFLKDKVQVLWVIMSLNITVSLFYFLMEVTDVFEEDFNFAFYPMQAFIIQPLLIYGYYHAYSKLIVYHSWVIKTFKNQLS